MTVGAAEERLLVVLDRSLIGHVLAPSRMRLNRRARGVRSRLCPRCRSPDGLLRVTGVASSDKLDLVASLGTRQVVDCRSTDPLDGATRYDVIIDTGGNRSIRDLRRAPTPTGTLVIVGGANGGRWIGGVDRQLRAKLTSAFTRQRLTTFVATENAAHLERLADLAENGHVTP